MHRIHLNIGSNTGDRLSLIGKAVALLAKAFPHSRILLSDYIETEPWGFSSPHRFLNRGALILTPEIIAPEDILRRTQAIERAVGGPGDSHRNPDGSYRDRRIDIDIIDVDSIIYQSPSLTLPHPRAAERQFVIQPMSQLNNRAAQLFWHDNCCN